MRYTFDQYLDDTERMTNEDQAFFGTLEGMGTGLLAQLVRDAHRARMLMGFDWLNYDILYERLRAGIEWVGLLGWEPRAIPNVFFQESDPEIDRFIFALLKKRCGNREDVPPEVHYLHTGVNWNGNLQFSQLQRAGNWSIPPLHQYNSGFPTFGFQPRAQHITLGYQLPGNFPELLCVNGDVATEYVARITLHDILHILLPYNDNLECVHAATCIVAGGAFEARAPATTPWERFVLDECTDPFFALELDHRAEEVRRLEGLTALQRWYIESFFQRGLSISFPERVRDIFGVVQGTPASLGREMVIARAFREREGRWPSWFISEKRSGMKS